MPKNIGKVKLNQALPILLGDAKHVAHQHYGAHEMIGRCFSIIQQGHIMKVPQMLTLNVLIGKKMF